MDPNTNNDNQASEPVNPPATEPAKVHKELTLTPTPASETTQPIIPQDVVPVTAPADPPADPVTLVSQPTATEDTISVAESAVAEETPFVASEPVVSGDFTPTGTMTGAVTSNTSSTTSSKKPRSKLLKVLVLVLLVVIVLGGGSAAAYFTVVVPNKPANVLKTALVNTLTKPQSTFNGNFTTNPTKGEGVATKTTFMGGVDSKAKAADLQLNVTVSGVSLPAEVRYVGGNLYFKLGDLSAISGILKSYSPDYASVVDALAGKLSNQWFVVDSTVIDSSTSGKCFSQLNWTLSKSDVDQLTSQYSKNPFVTITSSSSDTVNGAKAEKYVLSIDDDKTVAYAKSLHSTDLYKEFQKCGGYDSTNDSSAADHKQTPLTVWVDKSSKRIVQVAASTTADDEKTSGQSASFISTFSDKPVTVTAPTGAEPIAQLYADLQSAFGGSAADSSTLGDSSAASVNTTGSDNSQFETLNAGNALSGLNLDQFFKRF